MPSTCGEVFCYLCFGDALYLEPQVVHLKEYRCTMQVLTVIITSLEEQEYNLLDLRRNNIICSINEFTRTLFYQAAKNTNVLCELLNNSCLYSYIYTP